MNHPCYVDTSGVDFTLSRHQWLILVDFSRLQLAAIGHKQPFRQ